MTRQRCGNSKPINISTHILTKRMTTSLVSYGGSGNISTHILTKRMTRFSQLWWVIHRVFQLTSSRRGWRVLCHYWHNLEIFQLTSSRRGWPMRFCVILKKRYFNSHPHEEDDRLQESPRLAQIISTHILTKRMTYRTGSLGHYSVISTHILTKRMTDLYRLGKATKLISTHILTKRMTISTMCFPVWHVHFNSHPHEEDDRSWSSVCWADSISTHILTKRMT